ncbi:hypothetical protein [Clostridium estertheticum]|uniref:hypothetical protein n=1 Tax=Clostridium estertheticum TaxID=238834 RepID=UPI000A898409
MAIDGKQKIVLGSGKLYTTEFVSETLPTDLELEVPANLLGLIQGGATLEYKPKYYEAKDDLGLVSKTILTEEEVTLKSGLMTWNGDTLERLCATARVDEQSTPGKRIVKIGGMNNQDRKKYVIRFVYLDAVDGNIRVTIVGNNQAGFSFKFAADKETVVDAEFIAAPMDNEGTKIIYEEDIPGTVTALTAVSIAGTTSGTTKITVTPTLTIGNSYMYKTATTVTRPSLNDICNVASGYTAWDGIIDIAAVTGNKIGIVEVDSAFKAIKAGEIVVTSLV